MPTYKVQMGGTVYHEVIIEANNEEEALESGIVSLMSGEGYEVNGSFEWQDDTWVEEIGDDEDD
jgi:hypothetical protein